MKLHLEHTYGCLYLQGGRLPFWLPLKCPPCALVITYFQKMSDIKPFLHPRDSYAQVLILYRWGFQSHLSVTKWVYIQQQFFHFSLYSSTQVFRCYGSTPVNQSLPVVLSLNYNNVRSQAIFKITKQFFTYKALPETLQIPLSLKGLLVLNKQKNCNYLPLHSARVA